MKRIFFIFLSLSLTLATHAQNLVPNPSFEDYGTATCGINSTFSWTVDHWSELGTGSVLPYYTNVAHTCYNYQPFSQYSGPIGIRGNQLPRTGKSFIGLFAYTIPAPLPTANQRQYITTALNSPLEVGEKYVVSFYASLADSTERSINTLGAYLSTNNLSGTVVGNYTPQVVTDTFLDDVTEWVLVQDTITATSAYEYLTIGNFYVDSATSTKPNPFYSGAPGTYGAYYFIDDVRVEKINPITTNIHNLSFTSVVEIFPIPSEGLITVKIPELKTEATASIYHINGKLIQSTPIQSTREVLDLQHLNTG